MILRPGRILVVAVAVAASVAAGMSLSRADAPPGRYTMTSSAVYDTATGLTWERVPAATMYSFTQAQTYCADLYTPDFSDWRLPSIKELETLVDESRSSPTMDLTAFPGAPSTYVWSGTPIEARLGGQHWVLYFKTGVTAFEKSGQVTVSSAYVRCVR